MSWKPKWLAFAVLFCACARGNVSTGQLLSYNFHQPGYSEGASVSGSFSGSDLDGNGILVYFPGPTEPPFNTSELTAFAMHFSGNSLAPAFNLTLDDLYGFAYEIDTAGVGDDPAFDPAVGDITEGIGAIGTSHYYTSGLGPNGIIGGYVGGELDLEDLMDVDEFALDSSPNLVLVLRVPEPSTLAMLVAAAVFMLGSRSAKPGPANRHG